MKKIIEKNYKGISVKKLKNGELAIMVRFKYLGETYPVKNFTKLFGCHTQEEAFDKLQEIKFELLEGNDPFYVDTKDLNYYFYERYKNHLSEGIWKEATTAKVYLNYYKKYIEKEIGEKKLVKISSKDIEKIMTKLSHTQITMYNQLKKILNPIFNEAIKRGEIKINPMPKIEKQEHKIKKELQERIEETPLVVMQKLYKAVEIYKPKKKLQNELNNYLYLLLLSGHRYGELLQLSKEDIDMSEQKIISPPSITKTKEIYNFPLPLEILEYLTSIDTGKIFKNLKYSSVADYFKKLVTLANIYTTDKKTITSHDIRAMMFQIMVQECHIESRLAEECLDQKQDTKLHFSYDEKRDAFEKYWKVLRD